MPTSTFEAFADFRTYDLKLARFSGWTQLGKWDIRVLNIYNVHWGLQNLWDRDDSMAISLWGQWSF